MKRIIYIIALGAIGLSSCGIYNKYTPQSSVDPNLFGSPDPSPAGEDASFTFQLSPFNSPSDSSLATISWRDFFTDPILRDLIDSTLARNTDLNSARIAVEQSQASLTAAKLGYLPSLSFAPSGNVTGFNGGAPFYTYSLPLQLNWDLDIFGVNTNQMRKAQAVLWQAEARQKAVQANLVSSVAQQYYYLLLLDKQLDILLNTDSLWNASLETQRAMWENGMAYSTAVNQLENSYLNVKTQIVDVRRSIRATENAICRLLAITPQHISRSNLSDLNTPLSTLSPSTGLPAQLLTNRPDIIIADHVLEEAFYNTQAARAAFYPKLSLQGILGWANMAGMTVVNPGALLLQALASVVQPIFAQGKLRANLRISQLSQEDIAQQYTQTVINAGNQVNEALADCQVAKEKDVYYKRQVEVLRDAYDGTHQLMDAGRANYLEVLTAQETLLNAQMNEASNLYRGTQALIALYIALGGATK